METKYFLKKIIQSMYSFDPTECSKLVDFLNENDIKISDFLPQSEVTLKTIGIQSYLYNIRVSKSIRKSGKEIRFLGRNHFLFLAKNRISFPYDKVALARIYDECSSRWISWRYYSVIDGVPYNSKFVPGKYGDSIGDMIDKDHHSTFYQYFNFGDKLIPFNYLDVYNLVCS